MQGDLVVTHGYNGWGNRKSGCEAYGPGGRWAGPIELPNRANSNVVYGDLLGDHLDELGCGEGSHIVIISSTSRFDTAELRSLGKALDKALRQREHEIEFRDDGWTIAHPIWERLDGSLFDCALNWHGDDPEVRGRLVLHDDGTLGEAVA